MKCPYCAEEIKDAATFCRHCGHDLSFFKLNKPMLEAVSSLDDKISSLEDKLSSLEHRMLASLEHRILEIDASLKALHASLKHPPPRNYEASRLTSRFGVRKGFPSLQRTLVVVLPAFVMVMAYTQGLNFSSEPSVMISNPGDALSLGFLIAAPISAGFWLRIKRPESTLKTYVSFGALIGVVAWLGMWLSDPGHALALYAAMIRSFADLANLSTIFVVDLILDTVISTTLFLAGVLFGKAIRRWRSRSTDTESSIRAFAEKFVSPDSKFFNRVTGVLERLYTPTLNFTAAMLTFVGSILTLYLKVHPP